MNHTPSRPTVPFPAGEEIAEIETHVQWRMDGQMCCFEIEVHDGGLVLRGHSRTYHAKQEAEDLVRELTRAPILANEIKVC